MTNSSSPLICLINRNYPPEVGATGYYAQILIQRIRKMGLRVHVVTIGARESTDDITYLKESSRGASKLRRLLSAQIESRRLIKTAISLRPDVFIVMTDPALLNYWASRLLKNQTWIYWPMDLFPEGFVANKLIKKSSFIYKHYHKTLARGNPDLTIGLGERQLDYIFDTYSFTGDRCVLPIGLRAQASFSFDKTNRHDQLITIGYVGNVGEAHDPELIAQTLLQFASSGAKVILRCYGSNAETIHERVKGSSVIVKEFVTEKELQEIDIHIVSLREEWTHICVPSKAISAIQKGCAILFLGKGTSDTWHLLQEAGWIINTKEEIKNLAASLSLEGVSRKKESAQKISNQLKANYEQGLSSIFAFLDEIKMKEL